MKHRVIGIFLIAVGILLATVTSTKYPQKNIQETCTLAALAASSAGSGRQCAMVNNDSATNDIDDQVYVKYKTGASPTAAGTITVFAYACYNSSTANCIDAGEVNGTDATITVPTTGTILPIAVGPAVCYANVGATNYICGPFSIAQTFGNSEPSGWGIVIQNFSGAALDATCTGCGIFYDRVQLNNQ